MAVSLATCPRCGTRLEEGVTHCNTCGIDLSAYRDPALRPFLADAIALADATAMAGTTAATASVPFDYTYLPRPKTVEAPLKTPGMHLVIASLAAVIGAVLLLFNVWGLLSGMRDYNRLMNEGVFTRAIITRLEAESYDTGNEYYIHYRFEAPVGGEVKPFQKKQDVSGDLYQRARVGQPIEVVYWPADPNVTGIKSELRPEYMLYWIWIGIWAFWLVSWMVGVLRLSRRADHLDELRNRGQITQGVVFDRWMEQDSDGDKIYCIAYAFQSNDGNIITRAEKIDYDLYRRYERGTAVRIRYLPDNRQISMIEQTL
ncbi:MAG: hypothetical protein ACPL8I_04660 [Chloroflexaceae bacterium]